MASRSKRHGFTIIEVILSVAITAIIASVSFGAYVLENRRNLVDRVAQQVAVDFQSMFTQAQQGRLDGGATPNGYGVYITLTSLRSYEIFVDRTGGTTGQRDAGETLAVRNLPKNTEFVPGSGLQDNGTNTVRVDSVYVIPGAQLEIKRDNAGTMVTATGPIKVRVRHTAATTVISCVQITPRIGAVNLTCA